jgi:hypothetical protein
LSMLQDCANVAALINRKAAVLTMIFFIFLGFFILYFNRTT